MTATILPSSPAHMCIRSQLRVDTDRYSPGGDVMLTKSSDGGKTFSHPRLILPMDYEVMSGGNNLMSKVGRGVEHTHMHTYYKYIYSACKKKKKNSKWA